MISKEVSSRILYDVRGKILAAIADRCLSNSDHPCDCATRWREQCWGKVADQILAISGTTDIRCPECKGRGEIFHRGVIDTLKAWSRCTPCNGTGSIPYKWKVSVVLENGELPEIPRKDIVHIIMERDRILLEAGYKQVVE